MQLELSDPYAPEAVFKCSQGCGAFQRQHCLERYGHLTCPRCKFRATLQFVDIHQ